MLRAVVVAAVILGSLVPVGASLSTPPEPQDRIVARRSHHFIDDGRPVGGIEAMLTYGADGRIAMRLLFAADGPEIVGEEGWQGVHGTNAITAEHFAEMVRGETRMLVGLRRIDDQREPRLDLVEWSATRWDRIPRRRLRRDGTIDHQFLSTEEYPLEIVAQSTGLGDGRYELLTVVRSEAQARVEFEISGGFGRIVTLQTIKDEPVTLPRLATGLAAFAGQERLGQDPPPAPISVEEWMMRDVEGRWVFFTEDEEEHNNLHAWIEFLIAQRDLEFLEWMAIYRPGAAFRSQRVLKALAEHEAPQWVRAAVWCLGGDGRKSARNVLLNHRPGFVRDWLERHFPNDNRFERLREDLTGTEVQREDSSSALPPLDPDEVLRHLEAPADLVEFGRRRRAEPGEVYVHQVVRAIDALRISGLEHDARWRDMRDALREHPHWRVRQAVFLAWSRGGRIEYLDATLQTIDDPDEDPRVIEAAVLVLDSISHPRAYIALHARTFKPEHPGWRAAISRLGDVGDEFTLRLLGPLRDDKALDDERREFLAHELDRIAGRAAARSPNLQGLIERAAWAGVLNDPREAEYVGWMRDRVTAALRDSPRTAQMLDRMRVTWGRAAQAEGVERELRAKVLEYLFEFAKLYETHEDDGSEDSQGR